jgi:hypothetical protein
VLARRALVVASVALAVIALSASLSGCGSKPVADADAEPKAVARTFLSAVAEDDTATLSGLGEVYTNEQLARLRLDFFGTRKPFRVKSLEMTLILSGGIWNGAPPLTRVFQVKSVTSSDGQIELPPNKSAPFVWLELQGGRWILHVLPAGAVTPDTKLL